MENERSIMAHLPERLSGGEPIVNWPRAWLIIAVVLMLGVGIAAFVIMALGGGGAPTHRTPVSDVSNLAAALDMFATDNGRYPTTDEELEALLTSPAGMEQTWHGPYVARMPVDRWGSLYHYSSPKAEGSAGYDLHSLGPDKMDGTADDVPFEAAGR